MRLIIRQILESGNEFPTFSLEVSPTTPVPVLKQLVTELTKLHPSAQRLCCFFNGVKVLLSDAWTVQFYGLEDCSNLFLSEIRLLSEARDHKGRIDFRDSESVDAIYLFKVIRVRDMQECKRGCLAGMQKYLGEYYVVATNMREEDEQLVDKLGEGGWGCLHYAAYFGSLDILAYLTELGADVNKESHDGWTALQLCVSRGHQSSTFYAGVSLLLTCPTLEINKMTAFRGSALHIASLKGLSDITELLLKANASMTLMDYKGRIPLQLTSSMEIIEMIPKFMGVQTLRKYSSKDVDYPNALDDLPEVPPPFCGELSYSDPGAAADVIVYIVLDILEADIELFASRDHFMDHRDPVEVILLAEICKIQSGKSSDSLHFLIITHTSGRNKFYSKHEAVLSEWEKQISYAVQLHKTKQAGILQIRDSMRLNTSFKDPEAPGSPGLARSSLFNSVDFSVSQVRGSNLETFEILQDIGTGSFGCVYKVRKKTTGEIFALKSLSKKILSRNKQMKYAIAECRILRQLDCSFIMRMHESFQTPNNLYMVLEYCPGKDLAVLLEGKKKLTTEQARFYTAEILLAIEYLHSKNIIYRDLKPENVLLDEQGHIKLADFGLAKDNIYSNTDAKSFCGSPAYLSPEVLNKQGAGKPADIYGFGTVLYELLTGNPPYYSENIQILYENINKGKLEYTRAINSSAKELLKALLNQNPSMRPGILDIKAHPFYRKVNWDALALKQVAPPVKPTMEAGGPESGRMKVRIYDKDYSEDATLEECVLDFDH